MCQQEFIFADRIKSDSYGFDRES